MAVLLPIAHAGHWLVNAAYLAPVALVIYDKARLAVRSQYWMLVIMVGFTSLALWLLAQSTGSPMAVSCP